MLPRPHKSIGQGDENEKEIEHLPVITNDGPHFPASVFGYQFAMDMTQDYNFEQLLRNFDSLEMLMQIGGVSRQMTTRNLKYLWCRYASHYLEWVGGVPELRMMESREKVSDSNTVLDGFTTETFNPSSSSLAFVQRCSSVRSSRSQSSLAPFLR
ncbi:hypothetical protein ANCCAN_09234 [Ancylostoma caninum]|uniref:Uncharacterized protein n=1 Tax=Ancylostoma caninum TaxID=29170 RepID=A0A368GKB8_ANCCA|nr:hypothetical protein ANCCAN_09234 [Ancylostoma caninum]